MRRALSLSLIVIALALSALAFGAESEAQDVDEPSCPAGFVLADDSCLDDHGPACPFDFTFLDNGCRKQSQAILGATCPAGSIDTGADCSVFISANVVEFVTVCPTSTLLVTGSCLARTKASTDECPSGFSIDDNLGFCARFEPAVPLPAQCPAGSRGAPPDCYIVVAREPAQAGADPVCPAGSTENDDGGCRKSVPAVTGGFECPDPDAALNGSTCVFTEVRIPRCDEPAELVLGACRIEVPAVPIEPCAPELGAPAGTHCATLGSIEGLVCTSPAARLIRDTCLELRPMDCPGDVLDGRCVSIVAPLVANSIRGTVRNIETGDVVFGVQVCARRNFPQLEVCGYTNRSGVFLITDLPTANFQLLAADPSRRYEPGCFGLATCDDAQYVGLGQFSLDSVNVWLEPRFGVVFPPTPPPIPTVPAQPTPFPTTTPGQPIQCPPDTFLWEDGQCYPIPDATPIAVITPTPAPSPTPEPGVTPRPTPHPSITATPEPTAAPSPTPEPGVTPRPTPHPSITATPAPSVVAGSIVTGTVTRAGLPAPRLSTVCATQPLLVGGQTCTSTDVSGRYEFPNLPTGNYVISVHEDEGCYGATSSCDAPTPLGVVAGKLRWGVDIQLPSTPKYSSTNYTLTAQVPQVQLYDGVDGNPISANVNGTVLPQINPTVFNNPLTYRVLSGQPDLDTGWAEILILSLPNEQTAWVQTQDFVWGLSESQLLIEPDAGVVNVVQGPQIHIFGTEASVGAPTSRTPHGNGWIQEIIPSPSAELGPLIMSMGLLSEDLSSSGDGIPQIALTGTSNPATLGTAFTQGIVQIANSDIAHIARLLVPGAAVHIGSGFGAD